MFFGVALLACDTGALDTLNDVSLSEEVHDDKGYEDQDTCGIVDRSLIEFLTREVNVEGLRNLDDVGKEVTFVARDLHDLISNGKS